MALQEEKEEDFSFQKLRGAVQLFEKKQKNSLNYEVGKKMNNSTTFADFGSTKKYISVVAKKKDYEVKEELKVDEAGNSELRTLRREQNLQPDSNTSSEDFSFHALQKKALKLEKKNGGLFSTKGTLKEEDPTMKEDFSFQKLKEKAQAHSTPIKRQNPATPIRTPIVHLTPQTAEKFKKSKTQVNTPAKTPLSSRRVRIPQPCSPYVSAPMPMNSNNPSFQQTTPTTKPAVSRSTCDILNTEMDPKRTVTFNPNRYTFTKKIRKEEVQATDDTIASVKTLSKWLSDDPFEKKKQVVIRKAEQIADKARAFEHEELLNGAAMEKKESRIYSERKNFTEGKVSQGKSWLEGAFGEGKRDEIEGELSSVYEKRRLIESSCMKRNRGALGI